MVEAVQLRVLLRVLDGDEVLVDEVGLTTRREPRHHEPQGAVPTPEVQAIVCLGDLDAVDQQARPCVDGSRREEPPPRVESKLPPAQARGEDDVAAQLFDVHAAPRMF